MDIEVISDRPEFEYGAIKRMAAMLAKEKPMQLMLKLIRRRNLSIPINELLQSKTVRGYRQPLIEQAIYYGFISQTVVEDELEGSLFYYLTEKGCKVLEACEQLGITLPSTTNS